MRPRLPLGPPGVKDVCSSLPFPGETLLAFVKPPDEAVAAVAAVPVATVRELLWIQTRSQKGSRRWQGEAALLQQLRGR